MVSEGGNITSEPEELVSTLKQVEDVRRQTRAAVHPAWFPLVLFAVAAGIFVAAFLAGSSSSSRVQSAGPMVAVALGYLAFARLERSRAIAAVSGLLAAVALAVGIADVGHSCVVLSLTFGVVFTGTGLALRRGDRG